MSETTTDAPPWANRAAIARPHPPPPAPVTMTTPSKDTIHLRYETMRRPAIRPFAFYWRRGMIVTMEQLADNPSGRVTRRTALKAFGTGLEAAARFRTNFAALNAGQIDAILADVSRNERAPQSPLELFFAMAKQATVQGYYTSEIGIHQELRYKGNKFLREFVGCETEDGKDCPHCGQKHSGQ